ncbi:CLUMA_CG011359, isoform B [Clunio marinus]|uniref:Delta-aminolevulinic acid dehydratase n=1 Tax=Clunio marinus TaxID=568069 RepID=A0A1J1ICI1_9DIPT|nr:CLUMA_CG011359, isoform B [Clunio marinus]
MLLEINGKSQEMIFVLVTYVCAVIQEPCTSGTTPIVSHCPTVVGEGSSSGVAIMRAISSSSQRRDSSSSDDCAIMAAKHKLHSSQFHPTLRKLNEPNVEITATNLMYPVFLLEDDNALEEIPSMPNVYRYGLKKLIEHLAPLVELGLSSILIFGVLVKLPKDENGTHADSNSNPVIRALPLLRQRFPELLIGCDVCLCPYTSHGHCGIVINDAAKSAPQFGDRRAYQLPSGSRGLGIRAARRDIDEGADMLMVKPGMSYLDIVRDVKNEFPEYPLFIYQVSGEYSMLIHGAKAGAFELKTVLNEVLTSMRRAGADCIITYFVPTLLQWMKTDRLN